MLLVDNAGEMFKNMTGTFAVGAPGRPSYFSEIRADMSTGKYYSPELEYALATMQCRRKIYFYCKEFQGYCGREIKSCG